MPSSHQIAIEMHCHTVFSPDAKRTPEQVVEAAAAKGVHTLSITDHNHLGGQQRAVKHAQQFDLRYIPGVEIDAVTPGGLNCHFVCFDYDLNHEEFRAMARRTSSFYPERFLQIHPFLKDYGIDLSLEEMELQLAERYPTNPEAAVNQWFARDLLLEKQLIPDAAAFTQITQRISQKLREDGNCKVWPQTSFETMRNTVHGAGGKVLLAHVSRYLPGEMDKQLALIEELLAIGMDGFELYHPNNTREAEFSRLKDMAQNIDCLLSSGSDCHDVLDENRNQHFGNMAMDDWFLDRII